MANPATKRIAFRGYAPGAFHSDPTKEEKRLSETLDREDVQKFSTEEDSQMNLSERFASPKIETRPGPDPTRRMHVKLRSLFAFESLPKIVWFER